MTSQLADMTSSTSFICRCFVFLVKISYWSKFHVNVITGSGVMTIFFYKGLTRNPEIGYIPVWVLPISGDRRELGIPNLARMFQTKCYRMLQNASYGFYRFWVIKGKPTGRVKLLHTPPVPPSQIRVKLTLCPIKKLGFHFWLIWKSICCCFDKTFVEVVTNIYSKNQFILAV